MLFVDDDGTERQPLVFVPTDDEINPQGEIRVLIATESYLDAELNGETVGTWCVDSETFIFLNQDDNYQVFDPCEDDWYVNLGLEESRLDHYTVIDWQIISYIINQYEVGDTIECPDNDEDIDITRDGIQLAIWHFTNPGVTDTCPVDGSDAPVVCSSGCAIIAEVEAVFGI